MLFHCKKAEDEDKTKQKIKSYENITNKLFYIKMMRTLNESTDGAFN